MPSRGGRNQLVRTHPGRAARSRAVAAQRAAGGVRAGSPARALGAPVSRQGGRAAAAVAGDRRYLAADHRSVLRQRRRRQGHVLAPRREPEARGARVLARGRGRGRARRADRTIHARLSRSRSDLPGAAHRAAARVAAALARRVPAGRSLGDLRHLHHGDLADHPEHRGRDPRDPGGLRERRARAAPVAARVLLQDHAARDRALHVHGAQDRHRLVLARDHRGRDADRRRRDRLLHLGRVEQLADERDHPRADLRRPGRLPARPRDLAARRAMSAAARGQGDRSLSLSGVRGDGFRHGHPGALRRARRQPGDRQGRGRLDHRPFRLRQIHAVERHRGSAPRHRPAS